MGFLTTYTVYNDASDQIKKHPEDVVNAIYKGMSCSEPKDFPVGNHCNAILAQPARHADAHTAYVHMGNTVTEFNPYSRDFKEKAEQHPEFYRQMLAHLEQTVKQAKKVLKELK